MKTLEELCAEKECFIWNNIQVSSSTVIALEKMVSDVQQKVEKEENE